MEAPDSRLPKDGLRSHPDAHPRHIYDDVLVGIIPERFLNNGRPSGLASWFDWLDPRPGERVVHIGCGTGYYTAVLAHAVSPGGRVTAVEIDDDLAPRAVRNLAHLKAVKVAHGDGFALDLEPADVIFINAGATRPSAKWLDAMSPRGRLFPLITTHLVQLPNIRGSRGSLRTIRFVGDWLLGQGGLEPPVSREGFLKKNQRKCWRSSASKSTIILQRMSSLSVRHDAGG